MTTLSASAGTVQFDDATSRCTWRIGKLPKDRTPSLDGTVDVRAGGRPPHELLLSALADFTIPGWSASGLRVQELRVDREEYKPYKGVRFVTKAGSFHVRF